MNQNSSTDYLSLLKSPISLIGLCVSIFETILLFGIKSTNGWLQVVLAIFAMIMMIGTIGFFLFMWWKHPVNLYPPSEYNKYANVKAFAGALQANKENINSDISEMKQSEINQTSIIIKDENVTIATVNDSDNQTVVVSDLSEIDEIKKTQISLTEEISQQTEPETINWLKGRSAYLTSHFDFNSANGEIKNLITESPTSVALYYWSSQIFSRIKRFDIAIEEIDKGLNNISDLNNKEFLQIVKAGILNQNSSFDEALEIIQEIINTSTNPLRIANAYRIQGNILFKNDKKVEAYKAFYNAYSTNPTDLNNLTEIANFYQEQNEYRRELFFRVEASKLDPSTVTLGMLGNCLLTNNLNNLAMVNYYKAKELAKENHSWIDANIGNLYNNLGLFDFAIDFLSQAQLGDPSSQYILDRISNSQLNKNKQLDEMKKIIDSMDDK